MQGNLHVRFGVGLTAGANVNATDNYGITPLSLAQEVGRTEIVELLRKYGAKMKDAENDTTDVPRDSNQEDSGKDEDKAPASEKENSTSESVETKEKSSNYSQQQWKL